jgi:integrase
MQKSKFKYVKPYRVLIDSSEELWLLLHKETQEELPLTLIYALERRNQVQSSTIQNEMRAIVYLYEHAFRQQFDLDNYLKLNKDFNAEAFFNFIRSLFVYLQTGQSNSAITGAITSRISMDSFANYWKTIQQFIKYWLEKSFVFKAANQNEEEIIKLQQQLLYLEDRFLQFIAKAPRKLNVPILYEQQLAKFITAFHPKSNTFESESVKWRNWAIFLLLIDSGIRRGELLNLYVADTPRGVDTIINIVRRPDNPRDPRKQRPAVKSYGRKIVVSRKTLEAINNYIINYRTDHARLPHLFLNAENKGPLSISSLASIFKRVSDKSGVKASPHIMRHTRHYNRLLELGPKLGFEKAQDIVCREGGWSPHSGIPETYIHQYNLDLSNKTAPFFLESLVKLGDKDENTELS